MIQLDNVTLDLPVFTNRIFHRNTRASSRSVTGGTVTKEPRKTVFVRALQNVTFTLHEGDRLALVGHNGAGKTTLLRVIAGLYAPTTGRVQTEGRIAPLFNLSFGMDMDATGYDNIWIRGLYLGMTRAQIRNKLSEIAEFSELDDFLALPIRTYSSGMRARLAFAISTHVDADILLLDEAIATGDAAFFQKARQQLDTLASNSRILVLASHSNKVLKELCTKALLLEHGKIVAFGPIDDIIDTYKERNRGLVRIEEPSRSATKSLPEPEPELEVAPFKRALLLNDTGALSNPGCRAVRKAYKVLFQQDVVGAQISATVPVNYWKDSFVQVAVPGKHSIVRSAEQFARASVEVADVDHLRWESIRQAAIEKDVAFSETLSASDLVVVNGEGSIHHNSVRSLALLALMKTALNAGKQVVLLNATIQEQSPALLRAVLPGLSLIHVREHASHKLLQDIGIESFVAPDLAFLAMEEESLPRIRLLDAKAHILVTGGVTVDQKCMIQLFDAVHAVGMRPVYLSIGDGGETELARDVCGSRDVPMIEAASLGVKEVIGFLKQFPYAISGRHHINIFLMRAGVPFIPLPSNTWKIEGTLRSVKYPLMPINTFSELVPILQRMIQNRDELTYSSTQSFNIGRTKAEAIISQLRLCIN